MGCIRPATPGFIVTLTATILLALVSFGVPWIKSVFFLRANISVSSYNGSIIFGTLGYCLELSNGTTCSSPTVGYELDVNSLLGDDTAIQIPNVVVKWLTYALVLHIVALALSAGSAVFGLLAHIREMSMTCCSTCVSGFAAAVALLAFVFDLAFFFLAKARINKVEGGSAVIGNAIWLTLAAWLLLFFSGCFYALGRCCISKRGPRNAWDKPKDAEGYPDQLRLDAVKAEADRKARQLQPEVGLPSLQQERQPLTAVIDGDHVYTVPYQDQNNVAASGAGYGGRPAAGGGYTAGGYAQAPVGTRAVDEYYNPTSDTASTYPPQPQRQGSSHTYATSTYTTGPGHTTSPPPNQYNSTAPQQYGLSPNEYGHTAGGTSYQTAASHQQYPTNYSQYDPYQAQDRAAPGGFHPDVYNNTGIMTNTTPYYSAQSTQPPQPDRSYTLGGDNYAEQPRNSSYFPYPGETHTSPGPLNTNVAAAPSHLATSPVRGPRPQSTYEDSPPVYDAGTTTHVPGAWGKN